MVPQHILRPGQGPEFAVAALCHAAADGVHRIDRRDTADSLAIATRLYSKNIGWTEGRAGGATYLAL